jgi:hypothetical protein
MDWEKPIIEKRLNKQNIIFLFMIN